MRNVVAFLHRPWLALSMHLQIKIYLLDEDCLPETGFLVVMLLVEIPDYSFFLAWWLWKNAFIDNHELLCRLFLPYPRIFLSVLAKERTVFILLLLYSVCFSLFFFSFFYYYYRFFHRRPYGFSPIPALSFLLLGALTGFDQTDRFVSCHASMFLLVALFRVFVTPLGSCVLFFCLFLFFLLFFSFHKQQRILL